MASGRTHSNTAAVSVHRRRHVPHQTASAAAKAAALIQRHTTPPTGSGSTLNGAKPAATAGQYRNKSSSGDCHPYRSAPRIHLRPASLKIGYTLLARAEI